MFFMAYRADDVRHEGLYVSRMSASTSSSKQGTVLAGDRHMFLRHDFRSARAAYESAAAENDAQAWLMLGVMAQAGLGTSADVEHAKECLEKAAVASDVGEVGIPGRPSAFAQNWRGARAARGSWGGAASTRRPGTARGRSGPPRRSRGGRSTSAKRRRSARLRRAGGRSAPAARGSWSIGIA